jgi:hypothetical protein
MPLLRSSDGNKFHRGYKHSASNEAEEVSVVSNALWDPIREWDQ